MSLRLYYDLLSQPARAVLIFLKVNNIPFTEKPVALRKDEHFSEEFKKINPFQKVPVIDDDGFILTESAAILKYLALKWNVADHWYPRDLRKQARVDEYLNWQHLNTRMNAALVFRSIIIDPKLHNQPINWKKAHHFISETKITTALLDSVFLKEQPYLCGKEISIADLLCVCELMQLYAVNEESVFRSNSNVSNWVDRVKNQLQPHFDETHRIVYRVKEGFQKKSNL